MSNVYDVLSFQPEIEKELSSPLEEMAMRLVVSGRLRIEADERMNYIRFNQPPDEMFIMFSKRELFDPSITGRTEKILQEALREKFKDKELAKKVNQEISRLKREIEKYPEVSAEIEIKLARALVQAAHPAVIKLILLEGAEVFVSFSHNIGELLDIQSWQIAGSNSGMQSTDGYRAAVYVSCGGNPFLHGKKRVYTTDGFPALARMMVIAGQELGHYSDIIRDNRGRMIGRHSVNPSGRKATDKVAVARKEDIKTIRHVRAKLKSLGLYNIAEVERHLLFYRKHRKRSFIHLKTKLQSWLLTRKFIEDCKQAGLGFIEKFPVKKELVGNLAKCMDDMEFNLTPQADVYKRDNPVEEEAIACVEALARVPQQVIKWGHIVTKTFMPGLYKIYYAEVIPACEQAVKSIKK